MGWTLTFMRQCSGICQPAFLILMAGVFRSLYFVPSSILHQWGSNNSVLLWHSPFRISLYSSLLKNGSYLFFTTLIDLLFFLFYQENCFFVLLLNSDLIRSPIFFLLSLFMKFLVFSLFFKHTPFFTFYFFLNCLQL